MSNFAHRLLEARKKSGLSQKELGEKVGTSGPIIGRYERGEITPSVEMAKKIADTLETSVDYLCGGETLPALEDRDMLERLRQIGQLEAEERRCVLFVIDGLLRDAQARRTYGNGKLFKELNSPKNYSN